MNGDSAGGSFSAILNASLERRGLNGHPATVRLHDDLLVAEGAASGRLLIAARDVARLRLYANAGKRHTFYEARIRSGASSDEVVFAAIGDPAGYRQVMRHFAQRVAEAGGLGRVEAGRNRIMAWVFYPACVLLLAWLTYTFGRHALRTGATGDWLAAGVFAGLFALFLPALFSIRIKPVASLQEIDSLLPPVKAGL